MKKVLLRGAIPSKKNSKKIVCRGAYPLVLPSSNYEKWHKLAMWEVKAQRVGRAEAIEKVEIVIFSPDRRRFDLTNKAESIMDLLVDVGILEDDNAFVCPQVILQFGGVDKVNPRAEVSIHENKPETNGGDTVPSQTLF